MGTSVMVDFDWCSLHSLLFHKHIHLFRQCPALVVLSWCQPLRNSLHFLGITRLNPPILLEEEEAPNPEAVTDLLLLPPPLFSYQDLSWSVPPGTCT